MKNYQEYKESDFLMDADFQEWVTHPSPESELFWARFTNENPHKKEEINRAKALLQSIVFKQSLLPSEKEAMWQEIRTVMQKQKEGKLVFMNPGRSLLSRRTIYAVAAMLTGCALFLSFYFFNKGKPEHLVATRYGEIREIILPDSSSIVLNANSNIKYGDRWNTRSEREVWIEGEAFFSVKHTKDNQPFIVHANEADIEVLGTEFNVMRREGKVKVSLNSGSVKIRVPDNEKAIVMAPGEIIEVNALAVKKSTGRVENLSVWKENKLVFDDTPFAEILKQLRYLYGWEFANVPNDVLNERLTGEVETRDEKELLRTLEKALGIEITKEGNTIHISRF